MKEKTKPEELTDAQWKKVVEMIRTENKAMNKRTLYRLKLDKLQTEFKKRMNETEDKNEYEDMKYRDFALSPRRRTDKDLEELVKAMEIDYAQRTGKTFDYVDDEDLTLENF